MKKLRLFLIVSAFAFMLSIAFCNMFAAPVVKAASKADSQSMSYTVKVTNCKSSVTIYSSPKISSKKLGRAAKGSSLTVLKANYSKSWHKVKYKGKIGYIQKTYSRLVKKTGVNDNTASGGNTPAPSGNITPVPSGDNPAPSENTGYTIDNAQFGIDSSGKNARATTDGINSALQWAKSQGYSKIKFAQGTYLIQCNWKNRYIAPTDGIMVPSGVSLDLGSSTFIMEPNDYPVYCIFALVNQSNITITGGTLIGDLGKHNFAPSSDSPTHEWGFGIITSASKNVLIKGVTIKNMTGDGIILEGSFIAKSDGGKESSAVTILNCDISNCRRQGISVIGAPNSEIAGNTIYNISGTEPQYGIDVEPEFDYSVDNLKIYGNTIYGCSGGAIACCKGANYEVTNNTCIGNNILASMSSNVKIYGNTIRDSFIRVMNGTTNVTAKDNILEGKSWVFIG